jgi:Na+/H+ antiporter NhaD/arsenite permease-like protein
LITLLIFAATYGVVAVGRVPGLRLGRTGAALCGAALMIATGAIGVGAAARAIDLRTIGLLTVMMAAVAPLRLAGVSGRAVIGVSRRMSHPVALVALIAATSGVLSALLINDTVCVALTPLVLDLAAMRRQDPLPLLLALATASNIGSVATIVGNPQNILIGSLSGVGVWRFTAALAPVAAIGLALDVGIIWLVFRRSLSAPAVALAPRHPRSDRETPTPTSTLTRTPITATAILRAIDWRLLLLFGGLFIVVGAAQRAGIDRRLFELLAPLGLQTVAGLSATAAMLSNAVSNVPAVMLFTGIIPRLPDPPHAWLTLAMASTLAGNLTILGSIANLIVVEGALRRGVTVSFWDYAKVGVPVTLATLAAGVWWIG